ncbi:MAG: hypothetical protein KTR31_10090 [Myxococcales bacterium]|nr:hypothetical protein [Myxococcales bacterium]
MSTPPKDMLPIDEFDLELEIAGADLPQERLERLWRDTSLDPARAEIAASEAWWLRHRPALRAAPQPPPRWRGWMMAAAVAAAVLLAWVLLQPTEPASPDVRPRGVGGVDVGWVRDGAPMQPGTLIRSGDQLSVQLSTEPGRMVYVATLQDDGEVFVLQAEPSDAQGRFVLSGRAQLDDFEGREWLVVVSREQRVRQNVLRAELQRLLPEPGPGPGRWVVEVTRGRTTR